MRCLYWAHCPVDSTRSDTATHAVRHGQPFWQTKASSVWIGEGIVAGAGGDVEGEEWELAVKEGLPLA
jgi:hypothetical protein